MQRVSHEVRAGAKRLLASEALEAYIPSDRRSAIAAGRELPERSRGAAMFADISGFTRLTEALAAELGGRRASEELTAHLNRIFHALIAEVDAYGGSVIYFSGDAITCWFEADDGLRAVAAAFGMQRALVREGHIVTSAMTVSLTIKVAVAVGSARRFLVGDPEIQLLDALAGEVIERLATAEQHAAAGEVIVDRFALEGLGERVEPGVRRGDAQTDEVFTVVRRLRATVPPAPLPAPGRALEPDEVRPWLLQSVYERLLAGQGEFVAELRPAMPMFVRFGGIDFEGDSGAGLKLDGVVRRAQSVLAQYGGSVLQLTIGDKGAYLYVMFGAPVAHEDDARRAVAAGLDLVEAAKGTFAEGPQLGIAYGRLCSGTYGHELRRTYCCLGDAVNLAARLMSAAPRGGVLVDATVQQAAGEGFEMERIPPLRLKGKRAPVVVYRATGSRRIGARLHTHHDHPMFGRRAELAEIVSRLPADGSPQGHVVVVTADAGTGKSRLLAEALRSARERGVDSHVGECPAFGANMSYVLWRPIWTSLLGLDSRADAAQVEAVLHAIDPHLTQRLPLLAGLLGIAIPDNELTRALDAKVRKESLEELLAECLAARARAAPLMLVLEDCHWIDPLSRDLLSVLAREAARLPVLLLLAERPAGRFARALGVERLPNFSRIELGELEAADAEPLIRSKARQFFGGELDAPRGLIDLVLMRAQGNPFYIGELVAYIRSEGVDPTDQRALAELELPDSLHSLILGRIDTLAEPPRRTLKVASVIGRLFGGRALHGVYPELGSGPDVASNLATLCEADLVTPERDEEPAYLFNHVVTQQVAYESLPFATRSRLHERVGRYIESTEHPLEPHLDLLAYHYWLSDDVDKKRDYLLRAGDAAQAEYANASAIDYFRRLVPLVSEQERGPLLRKLAKVLELTGEWEGAGTAYTQALELAGDDVAARAWAQAGLGELARKRGQYDEAADWLRRAGSGFAAAGIDEGDGLVLHQIGTLAAYRGDYDTARSAFEASLEIRRRLDDKASMGALFSNLGIIAEYAGDYDRARELHEQGIAVRLEAGDKWGVGVSRGNLGNIAFLQGKLDEARRWLEDALLILSEVGDRWMIANAQNNLANVAREQGDRERAAGLYADALRAYADYEDTRALAYLFEDVAALAAAGGDAERALVLSGAAEVRRAEIGTPRSPTDEDKHAYALAPARALLSEAEQESAREAGRALELGAALDQAFAMCAVAIAG
jgi:class 3 adenylate cyclase/tetratricopeptide (TPR) repeat protein